MCGIFGHIGPFRKEIALQCTNTLSHRGPDGLGIWQQENIVFGHRRLAILDLSEQAKQPMSYADGRFHITYNGELYNFVELRKELKGKGYIFKSASDTEVILAAFQEWGESCLDRFNGMWAFGIWDSREKRLFLSRDRFGKKPLFYTVLSSGFAFASEMKALFPLFDEVQPNIPLIKDTGKIFQYEGTEECLIKGIKRFPAAHYGWLVDEKLSLHRYWNTLDHLVSVPDTYEEQVEQFRELFIDACRLRMRSDVPIGTALSGGLDSSAVISTIARIARDKADDRFSPEWQHAFVAAFPGSPLDETYYAQKVTDHLGIDASFLVIDPLEVIGQLDDFFYLFEELYITSPIPFMLTYGAMKKKGIKVTLDGHGADECFAGYPFDFIIALNDAAFDFRKVKMILDTYYNSIPADSVQFTKLPGKIQFWLMWQFKKLIKTRPRLRAKAQQGKNSTMRRELDHLGRQLYLSVHETVLPTLLRNYDRYSMANGVEIRMPFMDHRIVSYAFSIPWTSKIRNGFSKSIIRDAVSSFMPEEVACRKTKIGFNSPIVDWMKGPLKQFFLDIIHSQSFRQSEMIDSDMVSEKIKNVVSNPMVTYIDGEKAWTMIAPYLWEQSMVKNASTSMKN